MLFAHVFSDGSVEQGTPGGITQENVERVDTQVEVEIDTDNDGFPDGLHTITEIKYCFSGLPPLSGGSVTIDGGGGTPIDFANLQVNTVDPECSPVVRVVDEFRGMTSASFYILLY